MAGLDCWQPPKAFWVDRRLPGITPAYHLYPTLPDRCPSKSLQNLEPFPGAACCERIELATYKAAPLQGARFFIVKGLDYVGIVQPFFEDD
jgi:hypothetical protein